MARDSLLVAVLVRTTTRAAEQYMGLALEMAQLCINDLDLAPLALVQKMWLGTVGLELEWFSIVEWCWWDV